jgi:hypothetical protein
MATTCASCGCNKISCGCKDSFLTTPPPCPTPADCPDPQPCSESFDSQCVIYTAPDITCNTDIVVAQDSTVQTALQDIVEYFCNEITIPADIDCGQTTVIAEGTTVTDAIADLTAFVCDNIAGGTLVESGAGTTVTSQTTSGVTTYSVSVTDSDWVDLNGFQYYTGSMLSQKPQCRRIGNTIHFRGVVIIPLSNDGGDTLIPLTSTGSYVTQEYADVYTDYSTSTKGVLVDTNGSITFNRTGLNAASSVIPTSVIDSGINFDNSYSTNWIIGTRQIQVEGSAEAPLNPRRSSALSAALSVSITSDKKLVVTTIKDLEETQVLANTIGLFGSSPLRYITSSIDSRASIPNYLTGPSEFGGLHRGSLATSQNDGSLIVGRQYTIISYTPGDQFGNVGAEADAVNTTFIATGTTPTVWTGSALLSGYLGFGSYPLPGNQSSINRIDWPFAADAAEPNQIGGFQFRLDGLVAYLCPCTNNTNLTVNCDTFTCPPNE